MKSLRLHLIALALPVLGASSVAQTLPPPSRTVYRCEQDGKVVYSDAPCLGAKRVDLAPTRGLDATSGRPQAGADVRREKHDELMSDALRPLLNESPEQRSTRHKRFKLSAAAKSECEALDAQIPELERRERSPRSESLSQVQQVLLASRSRFRELRC
jgi:hypothetical protein